MHKAIIYYTFGSGLHKEVYSNDSYIALKAQVNERIGKLNGMTFNILGQTCIISIEKVYYTFKSGKHFTQTTF